MAALVALVVTICAMPHTTLHAASGRQAAADSAMAAGSVSPDRQPGPQPGGGTLLVNNWTITPAGSQMTLGELPLNAALSPDGRFMLVVNSGAGLQSLQVISTTGSSVVQTITYTAPDSVFIGVAYSPDGTHAYAAGGGSALVHTFDVAANGLLTPAGDITDATPQNNPYPAGLSVSPDGATLYVANNLGNSVSFMDTATKSVTAVVPVGQYPYTTLASPDGTRVYVSNWSDGTISVIDVAHRTVTATIAVGNHPSTMILGPAGRYLLVADSNSDAISVVDTTTNQEVRRISDAPYPGAPLSSSPQGLALSPDATRLYVTNAGTNDVTVFALNSVSNTVTELGRIPTAWYPTAVQVSHDGATLFVTNAKGQGAGPTDSGYYPDPERTSVPFQNGTQGYVDQYCMCTFDQFDGTMMAGTLSTIAVPDQAQLNLYTEQVERNDHVHDGSVYMRSPGNPIPLPGGTSPIKHVIYIIKENRSYDQILGDEPFGNGNPALTLFGRANTPNIHALAERFGLLDNFYADAELSGQGHNWATSANANDYVEKLWPENSAPSPGRKRGYDFEGASSIVLSPGGYLWDAASAAHLTYRDYGEFYDVGLNVLLFIPIPRILAPLCPGPVGTVNSILPLPEGVVLCYAPMNVDPRVNPNLAGHFDPHYRLFDPTYFEPDRVAEWQREFNQFVADGNLPQLEIIRLPNDHTEGTKPLMWTPQSLVAQNDLAVGQIVDAVSHSKYWASTAIFVTEDDAQNGPDHVDAHRTVTLVVSPYTSQPTPRTDSTLYDTAALVRTMELILGLPPLSQYDAAATPMWRLFSSTPDTTPYAALPETVPLTQSNPFNAYGAQESSRMDFSQEDRAPMDALNRILWHAIKGPRVPYPVSPGAWTGGDN